MKNNVEEARRWLTQAANDLQFAKVAIKEGYFSQCCFISQQAAEKAVKAVHYQQGARIVIGHSIFQLIGKIGVKAQKGLIETAKLLDQFYITSRYPNGIPGGAPFEVFTHKQAVEAVEGAEQIYQWANDQIHISS
ncbi:MAG: HEPN domain-containing protein [Desulfobulbaceae bacterium]|nr:HEPN domain-containing protein [Desulfobulbaceae bacterium]